MNGDYPFLHSSGNESEFHDGAHLENDNLTPEQFLKDAVVSAYDTYMSAMDLDPEKYTLRFNIDDQATTLGREKPVITQENLHEIISEFSTKMIDIQNEITTTFALNSSLSLIVKAAKIPELTKDSALLKLQNLIDIQQQLMENVFILSTMIKELNAFISTSSNIENARIKNDN